MDKRAYICTECGTPQFIIFDNDRLIGNQCISCKSDIMEQLEVKKVIQKLTDANYEDILKKDVINKPKIAIVKVSANWCGPCKMLKNHYEKWAEEFSSPDIAFFEIDNDANPKFVQEYKVASLPTIIFFVYSVDVYHLKGMRRKATFEEHLNMTKQVRTEISK